jgi:hypothetical protein
MTDHVDEVFLAVRWRFVSSWMRYNEPFRGLIHHAAIQLQDVRDRVTWPGAFEAYCSYLFGVACGQVADAYARYEIRLSDHEVFDAARLTIALASELVESWAPSGATLQ